MLIPSANELSVSLTPSNVESATSGSEEEDYFGFKEKGTASQPSGHMSVDMQILEFLKDKDKNLQSLNKYPLLKSIFLRYNTTIPSSAPVERLFSVAGMTLTPKRSSLADKTFERLILIRANNKFCT